MKQLFTVILVFTLCLSLTSCLFVTTPSKEALGEISKRPNENTTAPAGSTSAPKNKEVADIRNEHEGDVVCMLEFFHENETHKFLFPYPISRSVIVYYTDGSTQKVREALEDGNIEITDLDRFDIRYYAESKIVDDIIDHAERDGIAQLDVLEYFFEDGQNEYYFGSPRSSHVIVYYTDGTEQPIKEALQDGKVIIKDLDHFGIAYGKLPKESR